MPSNRKRFSADDGDFEQIKRKRPSAYQGNFEQNLLDNNIYPEGFDYADRTTPEPKNMDSILQELSKPRPSLSPSLFPVANFKDFKKVNSQVISEVKVMTEILPKILGNTDIPSECNLPFCNLDSITNGTTADAKPDLFDGSHSKNINKIVRQDLSKTIIPTSNGRAPVAPNYFLEAKAPSGGADVAKRQACLDGAIGARAMLSLQNYGEDRPVYDGNSYAFSSIYHSGHLQIYAHHGTGPTTGGEQPEYHMTQLRSYAMTDNRETFIAGATACRNTRDLARQHRETFIQEANARAAQAQIVAMIERINKVLGGLHLDIELQARLVSSDFLQKYMGRLGVLKWAICVLKSLLRTFPTILVNYDHTEGRPVEYFVPDRS